MEKVFTHQHQELANRIATNRTQLVSFYIGTGFTERAQEEVNKMTIEECEDSLKSINILLKNKRAHKISLNSSYGAFSENLTMAEMIAIKKPMLEKRINEILTHI